MARRLLLRKKLLTVVKENETVIFVCMWTRETEEEERDRVRHTHAHTHTGQWRQLHFLSSAASCILKMIFPEKSP